MEERLKFLAERRARREEEKERLREERAAERVREKQEREDNKKRIKEEKESVKRSGVGSHQEKNGGYGRGRNVLSCRQAGKQSHPNRQTT